MFSLLKGRYGVAERDLTPLSQATFPLKRGKHFYVKRTEWLLKNLLDIADIISIF